MKLMNFKTLFLRILFIVIFFAAPFVYGDYSSYSVSELKTMEAKVLKNLAVYQKKLDNERKIIKEYEEKKKRKKLTNQECAAWSKHQSLYRTYSNTVLKYTNKLKKIRAALNNTPKTSLVISASASVASGGKLTLTCKVKNANGKTTTITPKWSVSNTKYATISGNTLTAKAAGEGKTVTVTATYGGKKISKKITIKAPTVSSVSISGAAALEAGAKASYTCKVKFSNGKTATVTPKWSVSNTKYASFSGSTLTAKSAGAGKTVTITATYSGKKATKKISVKAVTVSSVSISGAATLEAGTKTAYTCKVKYSNGKTATVTPKWSVSNTQYASFSGSTLTAKNAGAEKTVTITATYSGKKATKKVSIKPFIKSISLSGADTVVVGNSATYKYTVTYSNGKTATVTPKWSVSNTQYASFSGNTLTAKSAGAGKTVTITASYNGKTMSRTISIQSNVTALSISGPSLITAGYSGTYQCTAFYSNGKSSTVTPQWSVLNSAAGFIGNTLVTKSSSTPSVITITATYQGQKVSKLIIVNGRR